MAFKSFSTFARGEAVSFGGAVTGHHLFLRGDNFSAIFHEGRDLKM